jgi:hypothetical protein
MTTELQILNRGSVPTFSTSRREEVIDITFCTNYLVGKISRWRVSKKVSLSDHRHILFTLSGAQGRHITFRNPNNTDWGQYRVLLKEYLMQTPHKFNKVLEKDAAAVRLQMSTISSYVANCPLKTPRDCHRLPW